MKRTAIQVTMLLGLASSLGLPGFTGPASVSRAPGASPPAVQNVTGPGAFNAHFAYVNWTDLVVTHPAMNFWDQSTGAFLDERNSRIDSPGNLAVSQALQRELETICSEEKGLIPAMNEMRRQWQSDNPKASMDAIRNAFAAMEETYRDRTAGFALRRAELEKRISDMGWSSDDLIFNREKHFQKTVGRIASDIDDACARLMKNHGLSAIFDGSPPPCPEGPDITSPPFDMIAGNPLADFLSLRESGNYSHLSENLETWLASAGKSLEPMRRLGGPWLIPVKGRNLTLEAMKIIREKYKDKDARSK